MMPPFLSACTFSASLHIPRFGGLEYELQIKQQTDLAQKTLAKNTIILFSVQVQLRIQEAFGKSCACCASPFLRFKYELGFKNENQTIWVFCTRFVSRRRTLSQHMIKCKGETYCDKFLSKARELSLKTRTILLPNVKLVVNSIRSLIITITKLSNLIGCQLPSFQP